MTWSIRAEISTVSLHKKIAIAPTNISWESAKHWIRQQHIMALRSWFFTVTMLFFMSYCAIHRYVTNVTRYLQSRLGGSAEKCLITPRLCGLFDIWCHGEFCRIPYIFWLLKIIVVCSGLQGLAHALHRVFLGICWTALRVGEIWVDCFKSNGYNAPETMHQ